MKRIYKEFSYGKVLVGYEYKNHTIEIEEEFTRGIYGSTRKWYHTVLKNGKKICSNKLYEIKDEIERDI